MTDRMRFAGSTAPKRNERLVGSGKLLTEVELLIVFLVEAKIDLLRFPSIVERKAEVRIWVRPCLSQRQFRDVLIPIPIEPGGACG